MFEMPGSLSWLLDSIPVKGIFLWGEKAVPVAQTNAVSLGPLVVL